MLNKRLGQHFLINKRIVSDIIGAGEVSKNDVVLEVGPGRGILTEALAEKAKKVIAVEKDKALVEYLKDKFSAKGGSASGGKNQKNIEIIYGDILTSPLAPLLRKEGGYKIIANIPYYITSRFLRMFLSQSDPGRTRPKLMVLMVQKEVAERIVAKDGKESLLSLSVKAYGKPKIIKIVKKGNFLPPPKIDSAIIKIEIKNVRNRSFNIFTEKMLLFARKAFQQKRKMLRHSLGKNIPEKYQKKRPEELGLEDWTAICLSQSSQSSKL